MNDIKIKKLDEIPGLESYHDYGVDANGNVYSWKTSKIKKLSPGWVKKRGGYLFVRLTDSKGKLKNFFVHRLVAMAFIPCSNFLLEVNHRNRNQQDNRIENLEWIESKKNKEYNKEVKGFTLNSYLLMKTKEVHSASIRKGLPVPDGYSFMNSIFEGALEQYISQYGLRKVMNQLPNAATWD
jgi:hypothetical protein